MNTKSTIGLLAALLLTAACISEPLASDGSGADGTRTPVTLSIRGDRFTGEQPEDELLLPTAGTRATADESTISSLQLLVFNASGEAVLNESFNNLTLANGVYRLQTQIEPGGGMQFYAIANADIAGLFAENLPHMLQAVTTLDELKALLTTLKAGTYGLNRTDRLLMLGNVTVDVGRPHRTEISLKLGYLAAKVTVTLIDKTDADLDIDIIGWDMANIPKKSNLLEQSGKDAVTGTTKEDYLTTSERNSFQTVDATAKTWSQTFYLFENRRGGRVDKLDPTNPADKYPGMGVDDNNERGKAWYAPPGATYLLVYGTHLKDEQKNNILYKIYLGENAVNGYNLARGTHYKYNVTINGLNDINVDTNVEWGAASFTVDKSDNLTMDAHPDCRVLRIGGTAVDAETPATATVEVLNNVQWLAVSPLNLYRHAVKQAGSAGEHQQFGTTDGANSFVRTKYAAPITATTEFKDATFAMTRKLTKIPFVQPAVCSYQDIMVYADAYTGSGDRTAQVRITYYNGTTVAGQQTLPVTQSGAIPVSADLFMECYEESAMKIHPALADQLQRTEKMQWGYNTDWLYQKDDRFSNGNFLTANAVYNTVATRSNMDAPTWTADVYAAYRAKYPRTGGAISETSSITTSGTPYYYPDLQESTLTTSYFHPIYNSSAARYCHEKNRDLDGDGIINANETVWYLPSYADMVAIKKNPPAGLAGTYWTSTEESSAKSWAFTFPGGTAAIADKTTTYRVRCVRGTGTTVPEATIESTEADKTKINLSPASGSNGIFKITDDSDFGLPWTVASNTPAWLKIATDAQGAVAEDSKKGTGNSTLYAYALTAHNSTSQRSTTLTLTRAGMMADAEKTVTVNQDFFLPLKGGNSNCYMVTPGGAVDIPVERANESFIELTGSAYNSTTETYYQLLSDTPWTACLVWESSVGLVSLSEKEGTGSLGHFKVTTTSTEGNAVVAIKNEKEEILWSWHIWVTTYDGSTRFKTNNGKHDYIFMDRNLGATSATVGDLASCGLYYQWGRKDPIPGLGQTGGSWSISGADPIRVYNSLGTAFGITKAPVPNVAPNNLTNAIRNPVTFYYGTPTRYDWFVYSTQYEQNDNLWSGNPISLTAAIQKSVFDPCPSGWRIPPWLSGTSPFQQMANGMSFANKGGNWKDPDIYFPATGNRNFSHGNFSNTGTCGYYWTASPQGINGSRLYFLKGSANPQNEGSRTGGFSVRCCQDNL